MNKAWNQYAELTNLKIKLESDIGVIVRELKKLENKYKIEGTDQKTLKYTTNLREAAEKIYRQTINELSKVDSTK